jgi:hypothetical protein
MRDTDVGKIIRYLYGVCLGTTKKKKKIIGATLNQDSTVTVTLWEVAALQG